MYTNTHYQYIYIITETILHYITLKERPINWESMFYGPSYKWSIQAPKTTKSEYPCRLLWYDLQRYFLLFTRCPRVRVWNTHADSLEWHHNGRDGVSNHQPHDCLLKCLFRCRSKKTSKLRVTGLCEFPVQMASNAENVSIWWRHHVLV